MSIADVKDAVTTAASKVDMKHPIVTWAAMVGAISTITSSKDDFTTLLGLVIGAKIYIISHWFAGVCVAIAANGDLHRSPSDAG